MCASRFFFFRSIIVWFRDVHRRVGVFTALVVFERDSCDS